jgi:hypothetical protein
MKDLVGAAYWVLIGALMVPVLYFTLFYPVPPYLLLIPITMGAIGVLLSGFRNIWALLIGFGGFPAAWLNLTLVHEASRLTWSCSRISFEPSGEAYGSSGPSGEEVICGMISGQYIVMALIFWVIMLLGVALWVATRRLTDAGRAV